MYIDEWSQSLTQLCAKNKSYKIEKPQAELGALGEGGDLGVFVFY
jgi:hypothetical protein